MAHWRRGHARSDLPEGRRRQDLGLPRPGGERLGGWASDPRDRPRPAGERHGRTGPGSPIEFTTNDVLADGRHGHRRRGDRGQRLGSRHRPDRRGARPGAPRARGGPRLRRAPADHPRRSARPLSHDPHRLPAVAGRADPQRPGGRTGRPHRHRAVVLRPAGGRAGPRGGRRRAGRHQPGSAPGGHRGQPGPPHRRARLPPRRAPPDLPAAHPGAADPRPDRDGRRPGGRQPHHRAALARRARTWSRCSTSWPPTSRRACHEHTGTASGAEEGSRRPHPPRRTGPPSRSAAPRCRLGGRRQGRQRARGRNGAPEAPSGKVKAQRSTAPAKGQLAVGAVGREHLGQHAAGAGPATGRPRRRARR